MTDLDVKTEQTTIEEHSNEQKRLAICGNCAAFSKEPAVNINGMSEIEGICRRSHPSVFMTYAEENGGYGFVSIFPIVNEDAWCMEWMPGCKKQQNESAQ